MKQPRRLEEEQEVPRERRTNWMIIALITGLVLLVIVLAYLARSGNSNQDKLTNAQVATSTPPASREKLCAGSATYELIKRELFRRAAQLRASDQAAFDKLAAFAVVRMENPVMESQDPSTGAVNCSGSLSLDLPPGVAVVGGRRTLMSDVDYTVTAAADGTGLAVLLRNAGAIITPLATLAQVTQPVARQPQVVPTNEIDAEMSSNAPQVVQPQPSSPAAGPPMPPRPASARPSFDCAAARTRGEIAVCSDAGLATLDRQTAAQYARAFELASPDERALLRDTQIRFHQFRDRCATNACIGDAYTGRMREIRDIMEDRWQPPR